jgi:hypothetical protein
MPRHLRLPIGNIVVAAGIFLSGLAFTSMQKFASTLGLAFISRTTYEDLVKRFVYPVLKSTWYNQRLENLEKTSCQADRVMLAGDGQHDSPGFCAKYCIYSILNLTNNIIIDFLVVQKGMFSGELEKKACDFLLNRLISELGNNIYVFLTDRHLGIGKMMREKYPQIIHELDIWHLAKNLKKKLNSLSSKYPFLNQWKDSIINHIWWCSYTCKENGELLVEKFKSILKHVRNIHHWNDGDQIDSCAHKNLTPREERQKMWLGVKRKKYDSRPDFKALSNLLNDNIFIKALKRTRHFIHTGILESYHNVRLMYTPKRIQYPCVGMVMRSILAILDHNANVSRKIIGQSTVYSKAKKCYVLKNKYEYKCNMWKEELVQRILNFVYEPNSVPYNPEIDKLLFPFEIPERMVEVSKPTSDEILKKRFSRFK